MSTLRTPQQQVSTKTSEMAENQIIVSDSMSIL